MTTLSSTAAKRRSARRLTQTNTVPSSGAHAPKRRKLRDQESLNLEDCFFQCEERGYHLDPDVRIGREVAHSANPFSILDPDSLEGYAIQSSNAFECPCHPVGPEAPLCQHSTSGPCASLAASPDKESSTFEETSPTYNYTDYMAPGFPTAPFTPEASPFIGMPGSFQGVSGTSDAFSTNFYLDNIRIPSPLLYHKSRRESVCRMSQMPTWDFPDFELAHGQPKPKPDFVTYRNIDPDNETKVTQNPHSTKDATLAVAKQPSLGRHSPQSSDTWENALDSTIKRAEQSISSPNHLIQSAKLGQLWRRLDTSDTLDMPGGFTWNAFPEEIDEEGTLSHTIIFERGIQSEDGNLIFPELTIPPNDQIMDVIPWSNNIVIPWASNTTISSPPVLETKTPSTNFPSPCRDLVLAASCPATLIVLPGKRQSYSSTAKLAPIDHHEYKGGEVVQITQRPKPIMAPEQESRTHVMNEFNVLADETLGKFAIRRGGSTTLPHSCHGALLQGSPCFETDEEDEGYFTSYQIGADAELLDHDESDSDWSQWEWEIDPSEEGNAGAATCE